MTNTPQTLGEPDIATADTQEGGDSPNRMRSHGMPAETLAAAYRVMVRLASNGKGQAPSEGERR
ncbi:MAG: hypothetical protein H7Z15_17450 [Rhizobacter sp.]|nr:hypothetical protein [Rhizobacter sp.]